MFEFREQRLAIDVLVEGAPRAEPRNPTVARIGRKDLVLLDFAKAFRTDPGSCARNSRSRENFEVSHGSAHRSTCRRSSAGTDVVPIPSSAKVFRAEHRQLPGVGSLIVANDIRIAVCTSQFEVPIVGRQPRVDNIRNGDATVSKNQCAWRLLAAMAGVALDTNREEPLFRHPIIIGP
jgi:hypothetical protein